MSGVVRKGGRSLVGTEKSGPCRRIAKIGDSQFLVCDRCAADSRGRRRYPSQQADLMKVWPYRLRPLQEAPDRAAKPHQISQCMFHRLAQLAPARPNQRVSPPRMQERRPRAREGPKGKRW